MKRMGGASLFGSLVALIIIGILAYVFLPRFLEPSLEQRNAKMKADFRALRAGLDQYRLDNDIYPTTEQGLAALVEEPTKDPLPRFWKRQGYINVIPLDPWNQPYQYVNNYEVVHVYSFGPKGKDSGTEIDFEDVK